MFQINRVLQSRPTLIAEGCLDGHAGTVCWIKVGFAARSKEEPCALTDGTIIPASAHLRDKSLFFEPANLRPPIRWPMLAIFTFST